MFSNVGYSFPMTGSRPSGPGSTFKPLADFAEPPKPPAAPGFAPPAPINPVNVPMGMIPPRNMVGGGRRPRMAPADEATARRQRLSAKYPFAGYGGPFNMGYKKYGMLNQLGYGQSPMFNGLYSSPRQPLSPWEVAYGTAVSGMD